MCFQTSRVLLHINMTREWAWSIGGELVIVKTPWEKATFHTILGAISVVGVVRKSGNMKRRKVVGAIKQKTPGNKLSTPKGTTGTHYMHLIQWILWLRFQICKDVSLLWIALLYTFLIWLILCIIEKRGYVYLCLCSFLHIRQTSIVKSKARRQALKYTETLR